MIDRVKRFFETSRAEHPAEEDPGSEHDVRVAACALFLEMADADDQFSDEERDSIVAILKKQYRLSDEHAAELMETARVKLEDSLDLWHFTNLINQNYTEEEKVHIVELMWRVVYADGKLDEHEDYLVHKLATLLRLTHTQLIEAKLRVLDGEE